MIYILYYITFLFNNGQYLKILILKEVKIMSEEKKKGRMKPSAGGGGTTIQDWWPNWLNLDILHQHSSKSNPMDEHFNYAKEFNRLDFKASKSSDFTTS